MDNNRLSYARPEIWGGFECTINRTREGYSDQLKMIGHYSREGDLEQSCKLGLTRFRYPVLWERHYPAEEKKKEWQRTAKQLKILRKHNVEVIAGLLHHGSGPSDTDLMDKGFPEKLATYAKQVATAFPWINYYTPVNEPLTTARFSGLYGIWYPHLKDDASFVRMLINQLKGIVLSMQAIRSVNPEAMLVQTEDLSKTHSSPLLSYQADFENERRWLTYDFLTGKVNRIHFAWNYFMELGIEQTELQFFLDNICMPAIAGFNYYVTSERYLDENLDRYPENSRGSNGVHIYCDTEAVRSSRMQGAGKLLTEAWWRFKIPMALTECQLACTREQQMRWFYQHFEMAKKLVAQCIPVTAITSWGLLGATDWDSLLSRRDGHYETGAFEKNGPDIRATALVPLIRSLALGEDCFHPVLNGPGWWEHSRPLAFDPKPVYANSNERKMFLICGNGSLGNICRQLCQSRKSDFTALSNDLTHPTQSAQLYAAFQHRKPWAVLYLTEKDKGAPDGNYFSAALRAHDLIESICREYGVPFLHLATGKDTDGNSDHNYGRCADSRHQHPVRGTDHDNTEELTITERIDAVGTDRCFTPHGNRDYITRRLIDSIRQGSPFYLDENLANGSAEDVTALVNISLDLLIDESVLTWENGAGNHFTKAVPEGKVSVDFSGKDTKRPTLTIAR